MQWHEQIASQAAQMLDGLAVSGDAPAAVRLRLEPSPLPRGQSIRVEWAGARSADRLADEARRVLEGLEIEPDGPITLRVEVLDGAGRPVPGATARRTLRRPPPPPSLSEKPMPDVQTATRHAAPLGQVFDHDEHLREQQAALEVLRGASGGAPADASPTGQTSLAQGMLALAFLTQQRVVADLLSHNRELLRAEREMAEIVRRVGGQNADLVEDLIGGTIDAVKGIADFRVAATQAEAALEHAEELAAATGRARPSKVDDLERISREVRGAMAEYRRTRILGEFAKSERKTDEKKADPVTPPPSSPADVTPPTGEGPSVLERILSGDIAAEVGAELVLGYVGEDKKASVVRLARAMLASAGEEASK